MWQIVSNHEKSVKSGMSHKTVKPLKIQVELNIGNDKIKIKY